MLSSLVLLNICPACLTHFHTLVNLHTLDPKIIHSFIKNSNQKCVVKCTIQKKDVRKYSQPFSSCLGNSEFVV